MFRIKFEKPDWDTPAVPSAFKIFTAEARHARVVKGLELARQYEATLETDKQKLNVDAMASAKQGHPVEDLSMRNKDFDVRIAKAKKDRQEMVEKTDASKVRLEAALERRAARSATLRRWLTSLKASKLNARHTFSQATHQAAEQWRAAGHAAAEKHSFPRGKKLAYRAKVQNGFVQLVIVYLGMGIELALRVVVMLAIGSLQLAAWLLAKLLQFALWAVSMLVQVVVLLLRSVVQVVFFLADYIVQGLVYPFSRLNQWRKQRQLRRPQVPVTTDAAPAAA